MLDSAPDNLVANPGEVEAILEVPLRELLLDEVWREERWIREGAEMPVTFFELYGDTIWGATGTMLRQLLTLGDRPSYLAAVVGLEDFFADDCAGWQPHEGQQERGNRSAEEHGGQRRDLDQRSGDDIGERDRAAKGQNPQGGNSPTDRRVNEHGANQKRARETPEAEHGVQPAVGGALGVDSQVDVGNGRKLPNEGKAEEREQAHHEQRPANLWCTERNGEATKNAFSERAGGTSRWRNDRAIDREKNEEVTRCVNGKDLGVTPFTDHAERGTNDTSAVGLHGVQRNGRRQVSLACNSRDDRCQGRRVQALPQTDDEHDDQQQRW
ncbi:hypothetical protein GQR58_029938 [Nymphon striatum]|nr:hypothetical protein GQR58_029938 [Nymphon striatum]